MAKIKTEQDENIVSVPAEGAPPTTTQQDEQPQLEPTKEKETQVKEPKKATTEKSEIPEYVTRILKAFSSYKELYIDIHGGAFAPDSPERVRGAATLYKNPYFKA